MSSESFRSVMAGWLAGVLLVASVGCAGFRRGDYWDEAADTGSTPADDGDGPGDSGGPPPGETGDTGGDSEATTGEVAGPSFAAEVLPLLRAGCERCHSADGAANATSFVLDDDDEAAYETALDHVDLESPRSSPLLSKGAGQGHTGGTIYDNHSDAYATILAWIEGGAMP